MVEYISKDKMLKSLNDGMKQPPEDCDPQTIKVMERFIRYVKEFPVEDVPTAKRGTWDCYICSNCKTCANYFVSGDLYMEFEELPNYCPNCGADMRETNQSKSCS